MQWLMLYVLLTHQVNAQPGHPPDVRHTYVFELKNGRKIYGYLLRDKGKILQIRQDAPWLAKEDLLTTVNRSEVIDQRPELEMERAERIARGMRAHGYESVETPSGVRWYPATEIALAQRARNMVQALSKTHQQEKAVTTPPPSQDKEETAAVESSSRKETETRKQQGSGKGVVFASLAIMLGALVLSVVILKKMVFSA